MQAILGEARQEDKMMRPMQSVRALVCALVLAARIAEGDACMQVAPGDAKKEGMKLQIARARALACALALVVGSCTASTVSLPNTADRPASSSTSTGSSGETPIPQYRQEQQQSAPSGSTQFPYSADAFLRALQKLSAADSLFQASTYNAPSYNGSQWWSVLPSDSPKLRTEAAMLANGLNMSADSFGGMFAELLAQGKNVDAARGLAFLINGNITLSGGCPNPALDAETATQLGVGLAKAISVAGSTGATSPQAQQLPHNLTSGMIADAALAGVMLAAKSCGPPNNLSSESDEEAEQKYLNSTCYFIGPILKPALKDSPALAQHLNATTAVTQVQDSWVSGAIFTAFEECAYGPPQLEQPPAWLASSYGPLDQSADNDCGGVCSNDTQPLMRRAAPPVQPTGG